jgi:phage terminase large subunit GpA-like protein
VADRPGAEILSFSIWSIYAGLESWATIAATWLAAKGAPGDEKRVDNQTGGEPYSMPGDSPPWGELKERAENSGRPAGARAARGAHPDDGHRHSRFALRGGHLRLWP